MHKKILSHWLIVVLLGIMLIIGFLTYNDYGITVDEATQRSIAWDWIDYIVNDNDGILTSPDKIFGPAFEVPLFMLETSLFDLDEYHRIYPFRHLMIHLFYLIGAFFFYLIIYSIYQNKRLAFLGTLLLLIHPRIYGHSFYNSKDIPFMVGIILCTYFLVKLCQSNKKRWLISLGVGLGLLINLRFAGIIYLGIFPLFYLIYQRSVALKPIFQSGLIILISLISLFLSFPLFWENPFNELFLSLESSSKWTQMNVNLFFGTFHNANDLPWNYLPVWIGITTPIFILVLFLLGVIKFIVKPLSNSSCYSFLFLCCLAAPIFLIIIINSTLYDGWRHLYFVYPFIVLIGVFAINYVITPLIKGVIPAIVFYVLILSPTIYFSVINHPNQHVYFNEILPKNNNYLLKNFERDYWGNSFYQGLKKIKEIEQRDTVTVSTNIRVGLANTLMFNPNESPFFKYTNSIDSCDYFISNYRRHPSAYSYQDEILDIIVQDNPILSVWKLK